MRTENSSASVASPATSAAPAAPSAGSGPGDAPKPLSADAQRALASSSQLGVVNPGMLADTVSRQGGDTRALAAEVRGQLDPADQKRFDEALAERSDDPTARVVAGTLAGGGQGAVSQGAKASAEGAAKIAAGTDTLIKNPHLEKIWVPFESAITHKGDFDVPLKDVLDKGGVLRETDVRPVPAGSISEAARLQQGMGKAAANYQNGNLAENVIEAEQKAAHGQKNVRTQVATGPGGVEVPRENNLPPKGSRVVDVRTTIEHPSGDPRLTIVQDREVKVGEHSLHSKYPPGQPEPKLALSGRQALRDVDDVTLNRAMRAEGFALEAAGGKLAQAGKALDVVGKVARPVGIALSALEVGSAFRADGNRIGENTGRAVSGLAGGAAGAWGGASVGAAIGTALFPGVGTVVGGVIGGIIGGVGGEAIGSGLFNKVSSWF